MLFSIHSFLTAFYGDCENGVWSGAGQIHVGGTSYSYKPSNNVYTRSRKAMVAYHSLCSRKAKNSTFCVLMKVFCVLIKVFCDLCKSRRNVQDTPTYLKLLLASPRNTHLVSHQIRKAKQTRVTIKLLKSVWSINLLSSNCKKLNRNYIHE